jgi:hypothetical protein
MKFHDEIMQVYEKTYLDHMSTIDICYKTKDDVIKGLRVYSKAIAEQYWKYSRLENHNREWLIGVANLKTWYDGLLYKLEEFEE